METWDAITSRRNVREFKNQPLPADALERILEAAWRAPSARNVQPWDFVVVTDRVQLAELSTVWRGATHVAAAAAAVVIVIDEQPVELTSEIVLYDIGQASIQMMIAAADLGIGSGHASVGEQDLARRILGLPEGKLARYIIDFGYPADRPLKPIMNPKRRPFNEVIHLGKW
jgi:nitroreductase